MRRSILFVILMVCALLLWSGCRVIEPSMPTFDGVVHFHNQIPAECGQTSGLRQREVIRAFSERELMEHYGLTFLVRFNDGKTEPLYGTLYYQNESENRYCMALPSGLIAVFADSQLDQNRRNVIQEICLPVQDCISDLRSQSR